jgi:hypothetical protein
VKLSAKISCFLATVLALSFYGCSSDEPKITASINQSASFSGNLPANPLQWKIITSSINTTDSTMSTLYGNDQAVKYARSNSQHNYPNGAILALVTWTQLEDTRWFGAKIPNQAKSVEFVFVEVAADGRPQYSYQNYQGAPLKLSTAQIVFTPSDRAAYLLSQRAAVMP